MTSYMVWLKGDGEGCDYSIGCNERLIALLADDAQAAVVEAECRIGEYDGELRIAKATLLIVQDAKPLDAQAVYARREEETQAETEAATEEASRALYRSLREKYGDKP